MRGCMAHCCLPAAPCWQLYGSLRPTAQHTCIKVGRSRAGRLSLMMGFSQWLLPLGYVPVTQNPAGPPEDQQMSHHGTLALSPPADIQ